MPPPQQTSGVAAAGDMAEILPASRKRVQGLKGVLSDRTEAEIYTASGYNAMDTDIVVESLISQVFNNEKSRFDFAVRKQHTVPAGSVLFIYEIYRGLIDKMYIVYNRSRRVKRARLGPPWRCLRPLWHAISSPTSCSQDNEVYEDDLVDYDEEVENAVDGAVANPSVDVVKKWYVRIHSSGFRDFLLKPELLRAI